MPHDIDDGRTEGNGRGRRRVLVSLGAAVAAGLAGCSGDDGPSGDGAGDGGAGGGANPLETGDSNPGTDGDTGSGPSDSTDAAPSDGGATGPGEVGPATCSDLTTGYVALDPGERPQTFRCERPEVLSDLTYTSPPGFGVQMRPPNASDADYPKLLRVTQSALERGQAEEPYEPDTDQDGISAVEFEFAGETLRAGVSAGEGNTAAASVRLPYEFERGKRYVLTNILLRVFVEVNGGSLGEECAPNMEESLLHVVNSLEPNPQTTIQSATEEYN